MNTRRGGVNRMPSPKALPPGAGQQVLVAGGVLVVEQVEEVGEQLQAVAGEAVVVEQAHVDDAVGRVAQRARGGLVALGIALVEIVEPEAAELLVLERAGVGVAEDDAVPRTRHRRVVGDLAVVLAVGAFDEQVAEQARVPQVAVAVTVAPGTGRPASSVAATRIIPVVVTCARAGAAVVASSSASSVVARRAEFLEK